MGFRDDFVWGAASASYQVEGAVREDGRGASVWDMFCKEGGRVLDGSSGDTACDHYHRYKEDIAIMKELGLKAYRFSLAWPRIIPDGDGAVNEKGLDFYERLIDALGEAGITPYVTLFHWDYPYELFRRGGWMNGESPRWFLRYVEAAAKRLAGKIPYVFTFNEPQCFIGLSCDHTEHAPGIHYPVWDTLLMTHHVLLAHGLAVQALRALSPSSKIGYAPTGSAHYPATDSAEDREAARQAYFAVEDWLYWSVSLWSDPVFLGNYPGELIRKYEAFMPPIGAGDMKIISSPLDFLGQNIYNGSPVKQGGPNGYEYARRETGYAFTAAKWPVTPESLYWGPRFLYERYHAPLYITENGLSCADVVSLDDRVHDPARIDFLARYLRCLKRAADDGVDIRGYFQWSLTDNFEWAKGYTDRFGIVYCDFETQQRIIKDSGYWYRDLIQSNGAAV
ncbi:MAG: beta-glucosidase [Treponema sp.]|jgi:beta-glucosidase|nr:beta-glucosidase [Treponema sp.]